MLYGRRRFRGKARAGEWGPSEVDFYQHCTWPGELRCRMGSGQSCSSARVGGEGTASPLVQGSVVDLEMCHEGRAQGYQ